MHLKYFNAFLAFVRPAVQWVAHEPHTTLQIPISNIFDIDICCLPPDQRTNSKKYEYVPTCYWEFFLILTTLTCYCVFCQNILLLYKICENS